MLSMTAGLIVLTGALAAASTSGGSAQDAAVGSSSPMCIGVMAATMAGVAGDAAESGVAARDLLVSFLSGPRLKPIALDSRVRLQAVEEARQKECPYLAMMTVTLKRGGGGGFGRVLGEAAGSAAWHMPGGSGAGSIARGVSAGAARAIAGIAATTRAKDEVRLEWTLSTPAKAGTPAVSRSDKLKASADGEDLLTPLVQRAAESIAETVLK